MKCIILAAGYATRLYPLTIDIPKPLLSVAGKTIIDWLIEDLQDAVDEFIVVTNNKFFNNFTEWAKHVEKVRIINDGTNSNANRLGAVNDISLVADIVDKDCLVIAGDNLLDFSLKRFVNYAQKKGTACVMYYQEERIEALRKTAVITIDNEERIISYEEKPQEPKGMLAVPPFYYYLAGNLAYIPEALSNGCSSDAPGSFAAWLSKNETMHAFHMPGRRYDVGDIESYHYVQKVYGGIIK